MAGNRFYRTLILRIRGHLFEIFGTFVLTSILSNGAVMSESELMALSPRVAMQFLLSEGRRKKSRFWIWHCRLKPSEDKAVSPAAEFVSTERIYVGYRPVVISFQLKAVLRHLGLLSFPKISSVQISRHVCRIGGLFEVMLAILHLRATSPLKAVREIAKTTGVTINATCVYRKLIRID